MFMAVIQGYEFADNIVFETKVDTKHGTIELFYDDLFAIGKGWIGNPGRLIISSWQEASYRKDCLQGSEHVGIDDKFPLIDEILRVITGDDSLVLYVLSDVDSYFIKFVRPEVSVVLSDMTDFTNICKERIPSDTLRKDDVFSIRIPRVTSLDELMCYLSEKCRFPKYIKLSFNTLVSELRDSHWENCYITTIIYHEDLSALEEDALSNFIGFICKCRKYFYHMFFVFTSTDYEKVIFQSLHYNNSIL